MRSIGPKSIFLHAIEFVSPSEWSRYVAEACGSNGSLKEDVERLLNAHQQEGDLADLARGLCDAELRSLGITESGLVGTQIGPYTLRELIGEGGMGEVYVAEQTEPVRRKVALKIVRPGMATKDVVARFEAERQALAMMEHPHIARVFDGGATETGQPYFVMELVQGPPITDYCDEHRLATKERLELFVQVCQAVQHAHQKGVVHRDLKPSNVLVPEIDGAPVPKVIDFGIAKATEQKLTDKTIYTQFTKMVGTPLYMSPEQAGLGVVDVDTRSDVYSLGVLLYELLTGTTPFDRETLKSAPLDERLRIIREQEPRRPSATVGTLAAADLTTVAERRGTEPRKLAGALRGELDWIVMRCLEKDRNRRYASAAALAEDLQRFLTDEPVEARPASSLYRAGKFVRRNRGLVLAGAAVFAALSIGLVLAERRLAQVKHEQRGNEILIGFLREIFEAPEHGTPAKSTLMDGGALRRVSQRASDTLADYPEVELELRGILAKSLRDRGEARESRNELLKKLELTRALYGSDAVAVADVLTDLAHEREFDAGSAPNDAVVADRALEALAIYKANGETSLQVARALYFASTSLLYEPNRQDEREEFLREALEIAHGFNNEEGRVQQVYAMWDLATCLVEQFDGRTQEAISLVQEAQALAETLGGDHDLLRYQLRVSEGDCLHFAGRLKDALARYVAAWTMFKSSGLVERSSDHRAVARAAEVLFAQNRHVDAEQLLNEAEQICRSRELQDQLAWVLFLKGWGRLQREDYPSAENLFNDVLAMTNAGLAATHKVVAYSRAYLAWSYETEGRTDEARAAQSEHLPIVSQYFEQDPKPIAAYGYARALIASDAPQNLALGLKLSETYAAESRLAPAWGQTPHFLFLQARASAKLGRIPDAIALLEEGLAAHEFRTYPQLSREVPTTRLELELALVDLHARTGSIEKARQVLEEGVEVRQAGVPSDAAPGDLLPVALARLRFAEFLVTTKHYAEAEEQLRVAWSLIAGNREAAQATLRHAAQLFVSLYEASGNWEEEAKWQAVLLKFDPQWARHAHSIAKAFLRWADEQVDRWLLFATE